MGRKLKEANPRDIDDPLCHTSAADVRVAFLLYKKLPPNIYIVSSLPSATSIWVLHWAA